MGQSTMFLVMAGRGGQILMSSTCVQGSRTDHVEEVWRRKTDGPPPLAHINYRIDAGHHDMSLDPIVNKAKYSDINGIWITLSGSMLLPMRSSVAADTHIRRTFVAADKLGGKLLWC